MLFSDKPNMKRNMNIILGIAFVRHLMIVHADQLKRLNENIVGNIIIELFDVKD